MKKLIMIALAACSITAFSITADEALASKNYYVINDYCKTNNISTIHFLTKSNSVDFATYKEIYNTYTNIDKSWLPYIYKYESYIYFNKTDSDSLKYDYCKCTHNIEYYRIVRNKQAKWFSHNLNNPANQYYNHYFYRYEILKEDMVKTYNTKESSEIAICIDSALSNNTLKDILYPRVKDTDYSVALDLAIAYNDVDKIIDALLKVTDITAEQANAIIKPINSVSANYRKSEILEALENINSRCTIKLYDDQKTWEPIISKIRAMISVRK